MAVPSVPPSCHGAGEEKGWVAMVLRRFPPPECQNQEGHLPPVPYAGNHGGHGQCPALLLYRSEEWVLAGQNDGGVQTVYHLHSGEHGHV